MAAWVLGVGGWAVFQVLGPMGMVGGSLTISSLEAAGLMCLGDSHLRGSMTAVVHSVWEGGAGLRSIMASDCKVGVVVVLWMVVDWSTWALALRAGVKCIPR